MNLLGDKRTNMDAIIRHIKGEGESPLTTKQQERLNQIMEADRLIYQHKNTPTVIKALMTKYPKMSNTTAWRLVQSAQYCFGPMRRQEKDYAQRLFIDDIWKEIEIMKTDRAKYHRSIAALYKTLLETYGFTREDKVIDPNDLEPHTNTLVFVVENNTFRMNLDKMEQIPMHERQRIIQDLADQQNNNKDFSDFETLDTTSEDEL